MIRSFKRYGFLFSILLLSTSGWAGPGEDISSYGLQFNLMVGDEGNSLTGSKGYSFHFTTQRTDQVFNFMMGAGFLFIPGTIRSGGEDRSVTVLGGNVMTGFSVEPIHDTRVSPSLRVGLLLGPGFSSLSSNSGGNSILDIGLIYGFQIGTGADIKVDRKKAVRVEAYYRYQAATNLADVNGLGLNSYSIGVSYLF